MQNRNEGNQNKIMLGVLNCTMDKIGGNDENKTQRLYRCCSDYALSKLIVDNGLEDPAETRGTTASLQQVTAGNTPNLVLKRMLRCFSKIPPLMKILQF